MYEFIKKNIYLIILFIITLSIGFLTFLTFIEKGFIELSDQNLQTLLVLNIVLLVALFVFIFIEIKSAIKNDIDKDGLKSNKKYITYFGLFTLIPSVLISIFSLFLFSFALEKYFDKKVTTVVNNSYELARNYVEEIRNKIQSDIVLIAFDTNKDLPVPLSPVIATNPASLPKSTCIFASSFSLIIPAILVDLMDTI